MRIATYPIFPPQVPPLPPGLFVPFRLLVFRRAFSMASTLKAMEVQYRVLGLRVPLRLRCFRRACVATSLEAVEVPGTWRFPQVKRGSEDSPIPRTPPAPSLVSSLEFSTPEGCVLTLGWLDQV